MNHRSSHFPEDVGLPNIPDNRLKIHRKLVHRHIESVIKVLSAEAIHRQSRLPVGCPHATPATLAHRREKTGEKWECYFERLPVNTEQKLECACADPLCGSDEPLDAVVSAVLSERGGLTERYFDHRERELVAKLRDTVGDWNQIASIDISTLQARCEKFAPDWGMNEDRISRLREALTKLDNCTLVDNLSLNGLPSVQYERLVEILADLRGLNEQDARWLVLTALDKPVFPRDHRIDLLLVELGLVSPEKLSEESVRWRHLEEEITPRFIPALHRALAAHAYFCEGVHSNTECEFSRFTVSQRISAQSTRVQGPGVVDLFSGAGGLSLGFSDEDYRILLAVDHDQYAIDTYRLNHPQVINERVKCDDVSHIAKQTDLLSSLENEVDIVIGGPPCQALSIAGYRSRLASDDTYSVLDDPRTQLYKEYVTIIQKLDPSLLVMENVEGILSELGNSGIRVIDKVQQALQEINFESKAELIGCSRYGIPQDRQRVILLGANGDHYKNSKEVIEGIFQDLESRESNQPTTLRQGLSNLPRLRRGEGNIVLPGKSRGRLSDYVSTNDIADNTDLTFNHRARKHAMQKDRELFDDVLEPGDTGWQAKYEKGRGDLIDYDVGTKENPKFKDKYRMLEWEQPAPTIVAHLEKDSNSFILPDYYEHVVEDESKADSQRNRGITPREAARLQSFPDDYLFLGSFTSQFRQIGNAVPPLLARKLASTIKPYLDQTKDLSHQETEINTAGKITSDD